MADYILTAAPDMVLRVIDQVHVPINAPGNRDSDAYQAWLAVPNVPDPYVAPPPAPPPAATVVLFDHENRLRVQEGVPPLTLQQFITASGL